MNPLKKLRILILALTLGSVLVVLVKVLLAKNIDKFKPEGARGEANSTLLFKNYASGFSVMPLHVSSQPSAVRCEQELESILTKSQF